MTIPTTPPAQYIPRRKPLSKEEAQRRKEYWERVEWEEITIPIRYGYGSGGRRCVTIHRDGEWTAGPRVLRVIRVRNDPEEVSDNDTD